MLNINPLLPHISVPECGGILFLLFWMLCTIYFQFTGDKVKAFIPWIFCGLLPTWSFFAPQPPTSDYHLLYRDYLADGTVLAWSAVHPEKQQWWMPFWNPQMRQSKALTDAIEDFKQLVKQSTPPWLEFSVPYLLLLHTVTNCSHASTNCSVQFLLLDAPGDPSDGKPAVIFLSRVHPLGQITPTSQQLSASAPNI